MCFIILSHVAVYLKYVMEFTGNSRNMSTDIPFLLNDLSDLRSTIHKPRYLVQFRGGPRSLAAVIHQTKVGGRETSVQ